MVLCHDLCRDLLGLHRVHVRVRLSVGVGLQVAVLDAVWVVVLGVGEETDLLVGAPANLWAVWAEVCIQ